MTVNLYKFQKIKNKFKLPRTFSWLIDKEALMIIYAQKTFTCVQIIRWWT